MSAASLLAPESDRRATDEELAREILPLRGELFRLARRYTRNQADAEDLVQEALATACAEYRPGRASSPGGRAFWIRKILTNTFCTQYRRRQVEREREGRLAAALYGADEGERCFTQPEVQNFGDHVLMALDDLEPGFLQVVVMVDVEGTTYRETAARLGIPLGTVMSRLHRARAQLEERLRDYAREGYGIGEEEADQ